MLKRGNSVILCLFLVGLAWGTDIIVDAHTDLDLVYMLPIALAAWLFGLWWGVGLGVFCLIVTTAHALFSHGMDFPPGAYFFWNIVARTTLFLIAAVGADKFHAATTLLERTVQERTAQLRTEMEAQRRLELQLLQSEEAERRRIGRDLHDSLGQELAGMAFLSKELEESLAAKNISEAQDAAKLSTYATAAVRKASRLAHGLCPVGVHGGALPRAVNELAEQVRDVFGAECVVEDAELLQDVQDENVATQVYRIAQEAVRNAIRHGKPKHIVIQASMCNGRHRLDIRDDGVGLSSSPVDSGGMGFSAMRYRAASINGSLTVGADQPKGTQVRCEWPADSKAARQASIE